jgi:metal-responsive CopG/Arc/MetJ family transcriptional regulator
MEKSRNLLLQPEDLLSNTKLDTFKCVELCGKMATNLQLEEKLLDRVVELSGRKTKKAAVTDALEEYVRRREQMEIIKSFGTVVFDPAYEYKTERQRKGS